MANKKQAEAEATPEIKLAEIAKEVGSIQEQSNAIVITSPEQLQEATVFAAKVKARVDKVEEWRTFFTKPLLDQKKRIDDLFKAQSQPLTMVLTKVKRAMSDYAMAEELKAREEEAKKLKLREAANAKRESAGKAPIAAPVRTVEREAPTVHTEAGKSTRKMVWKAEVVDPNKVPRQYLKVDEAAIRAAVKAGERKIEGVRIYEDFDFAISSNE